MAFGNSGCGVGDDEGLADDVGLPVGVTLAVGDVIGSGPGVIVGAGRASLVFSTTDMVPADKAINSIRPVATIKIDCLNILPPWPA